MIHRGHHRGLPLFLLLSIALHLLLLANLNAIIVIATQRLGQPVLSVILPGTPNVSIPTTLTKIATSHVTPINETAFPRSIAKPPEHVVEVPLAGTLANDTADWYESTTPDDADTGTRNQLLGQLRTRLSRYLVYPPLARRRGWEGTVLLGLWVEADGHLDKIRIERSSGYTVLDHSALNSLNRLGHLAEASTWLNGRGMDMRLPVIYRLMEY